MDHLLQPFLSSGLRPVMPWQSFQSAAALMVAVTVCLFALVPTPSTVDETALETMHSGLDQDEHRAPSQSLFDAAPAR